jgi:hypothetical protein
MSPQPARTSGRRVLALVACMLALGGASVGLDAATAHGAHAGVAASSAAAGGPAAR